MSPSFFYIGNRFCHLFHSIRTTFFLFVFSQKQKNAFQETRLHAYVACTPRVAMATLVSASWGETARINQEKALSLLFSELPPLILLTFSPPPLPTSSSSSFGDVRAKRIFSADPTFRSTFQRSECRSFCFKRTTNDTTMLVFRGKKKGGALIVILFSCAFCLFWGGSCFFPTMQENKVNMSILFQGKYDFHVV